MAKMKIDGSMILGLEGMLSPPRAIMELFDNSHDHGATIIHITISSHSMTIWDNGTGCNDPNLIATPSMSHSRQSMSKIGGKGIGAKQGMATFGRHWDIQTVPNMRGKPKVYHRYVVDWDERGDLPDEYSGHGEPSYTAPKEIRNGGTKIVVTKRQGGHNINIDSIRKQLEVIYRPALSGDLQVSLHEPERGYARRLSNSALEAHRFVGPVEEAVGTVEGRTFRVRYGTLKNSDETLSGCHYIFGPRIVLTRASIGNFTLPSACYVDVILGEGWKHKLNTNKSNFRYSKELDMAVEELIKPWLIKQQANAFTLKMRIVAGAVAANINDMLLFLDKTIEGEYGPKPKNKSEMKEKDEKKEKKIRTRKYATRRTRAQFGTGQWGIEEDEQTTCLKIDMRGDALLGNKLWHVAISSEMMTVFLNIGPNQRTIAELFTRSDEATLRRYALIAYAWAVASEPKDHGPLLAALRKLGYEIDVDTMSASAIECMVANFFTDYLSGDKKYQAPPASEMSRSS